MLEKETFRNHSKVIGGLHYNKSLDNTTKKSWQGRA